MPSIYHPGTQQAAGDAATWAFKDGGEAGQLLSIAALGALFLGYWLNQRFSQEISEENE